MKVLTVSTPESDLRSEIKGWNKEDSDLYIPNKPIGFTSSPSGPEFYPNTVLEALAMGWKLLGHHNVRAKVVLLTILGG